jgi:hypothetical protein
MQILRAIMTEPTPPLTSQAPWVLPSVVAVIEKAMQSNRDDRYANATEMLAALTTLLEGPSELRPEMLVGIAEEQKLVVPKNAAAGAMADTFAQTSNTVAEGKTPWWRKLLGR